MFLIMSGSYVGLELESEFGKLPPSFLPLGNKRLFKHQVALAPKDAEVFLSVPDSFNIPSVDIKWLEKNKVVVLHVPEGLSLGASLIAALNISGCNINKPLHVIYGDTLYKDLPIGDDVVSISTAKNSYNWAILTEDNNHWIKGSDSNSLSPYSPQIIDGYFKFSNPRELIKNITQSNWDFLEGLNLYNNSVGLTTVDALNWLDFGHVNTYYRSKAEFTTQRAFNELMITPKWIEKSGIKSDKISAEAHWFNTLPARLKGHTPQYLGSTIVNGKVSYRLEYLHLTALNELFVFGKLPIPVWKQILNDCVDFLLLCTGFPKKPELPTNSLEALFSEKTAQRLTEYCLEKHINLDQKWRFNNYEPVSLRDILSKSKEYLPKCRGEQTVIHGDFCFSNILYDFRSATVKTIDPRGINPLGEKTIYGDIRYDIAKLSHSILGMYDWIIAGYYEMELDQESINFHISENGENRDIRQAFVDLAQDKFKLTVQNLYAMQIQLFLSMLPLHSDNNTRQNALFANTFRLYHILIRLEQ